MANPHPSYPKKRSLDEWIITEDPGLKRLRLAYEADLDSKPDASMATANEKTKSPTAAATDQGKCGIPTSSLIRMVTPDRPSTIKGRERVSGPPMGRKTSIPFGRPAVHIDILSIHSDSDSSIGDANEDLNFDEETNSAESPNPTVQNSSDIGVSTRAILTNKQHGEPSIEGEKRQVEAGKDTNSPVSELIVKNSSTGTTTLQFDPSKTKRNSIATDKETNGDPITNCEGNKHQGEATTEGEMVDSPKRNILTSFDASMPSITTNKQQEIPTLAGSKREIETTIDTPGVLVVKKKNSSIATSLHSIPFVGFSEATEEDTTVDPETNCLQNSQLEVTDAECLEVCVQNSSDVRRPSFMTMKQHEESSLTGTKRQIEATADTLSRESEVIKDSSGPIIDSHQTKGKIKVTEKKPTEDPQVHLDNTRTKCFSSFPSHSTKPTKTNTRDDVGGITASAKSLDSGGEEQVPVEDSPGLEKRGLPKVSSSSCLFFVPMIIAAMAITWGSPASGFAHGISSQLFGTSERSASLLREIENTPKLTLREVLMDTETGFHLAMAPAFFGFYGYFGALASWYDLGDVPLPVRSVTGASAGAMAAVLIAAGIEPQEAADFCATVTLDQFADFPGYGALFKGDKFEKMMDTFLRSKAKTPPLMEESLIPVTVSAYDLRTFRGKIIREGSMARAARSSATFPLLFQPVGWKNATHDFTFIDGGIADMYGLLGLSETMNMNVANRVINLSVGAFVGSAPPGPSVFEQKGRMANNVEVISISLEGLPKPGPLALENGPRAYAAAHQAMSKVLDAPLEPVVELGGKHVRKGHYRMVVNAVSS